MEIPPPECSPERCDLELKENTVYCKGYERLKFCDSKNVYIIGGEGTILGRSESGNAPLKIVFHGVQTAVINKISIHDNMGSVRSSLIVFNRSYDYNTIQLRDVLVESNTRILLDIVGDLKKVHVIMENNRVNADAENKKIFHMIGNDVIYLLELTMFQNYFGEGVTISDKVWNNAHITEASTRNTWIGHQKNLKLLQYPFIHPYDPEIVCYTPQEAIPIKKMINGKEKDVYVCCMPEWLHEYTDINNNFIRQNSNDDSVNYVMYVPAWWSEELKSDFIIERWTITKSSFLIFNTTQTEIKTIIVGPGVNVTITPANFPEVITSHMRLKQIVALERTVLSFVDLNMTMEDADTDQTEGRVYISITSETSNVWFNQCKMKKINIISSGMGHLHITDSSVKESLVSATNAWISGSEFTKCEIVTMPYVGHMHTSNMEDSNLVFSQFPLGKSPNVRYALKSNVWSRSAVSSFDQSVLEGMSIVDENYDSIKFIQSINKNSMDRYSMQESSTNNYIHLPSSIVRPKKTELNVHDRKILYTFLAQNTGDQRRELLGDATGSQSSSGNTRKYYSTSYYNTRNASRINKDCRNSVQRCFGFSDEEMNTVCLTLAEWLDPDTKPPSTTAYCERASLFCLDASGCDSMLVGPKLFAIVLISVVGGVCAFFLAYHLFVARPKQNVVINANRIIKEACPNCNHLNDRNALYCNQCNEEIETIRARLVRTMGESSSQRINLYDAM